MTVTAHEQSKAVPARSPVLAPALSDAWNFIDGEWVGTGRLFDNTNPIDGSLVSCVHEAGRVEVDAAVKAAQAALKGPWGRMTVEQRCKILHDVADEMMRRHADFVKPNCSIPACPPILPSTSTCRAGRRISASLPICSAMCPPKAS
jgi:aminomuconate-semialdehyde/2-hydroxymuconate-6-semialdehyde dehydrogenase